MKPPIENFVNYDADTGMQCGNYSIDIPELKDGEQYRFHFDATVCIGCRSCEVACNEQNNNSADTKWRRVGEMEGGEFPLVRQLFNSMSCNHCIDPECVKGCPTNSYIKIQKTGIVVHNDDTCIGCHYCTWNCPYEVPTYQEDRNIVTKCHMCHEKLDVGEAPACVQTCPSAAIEIESINIKQWLEKDIDKQANMPNLADARITNSTTRYTLPDNLPDDMKEVDEHILKPAHSEMPLVFMTVLTQVSLGGFFALFLGEVMSILGFKGVNWMMALLVMIPASLGLLLSALHLGRPFLALTAMKNLKTSWLSREVLALGIFVLLMNIVVVLYYFEASHRVMLLVEIFTLIVGVFGIHAQAMIYRIKARPSWDRITTNFKFFGVAYVGVLLLGFLTVIIKVSEVAVPLITLAIIGSLLQLFFTYEDLKTLKYKDKNEYQLKRTARLYDENFSKVKQFRFISLILGGIVLPLLVVVLLSSDSYTLASLVMFISVVLVFISEISDRFLFYSTVVSLGMAGGFFVGKQRG
ncbi:MAG: dimethyl sulfoxide reductase anchor subunit [Sulfurimonas sp.]|nr:dimethyl sulfoxide reductase anchor subunit [Sulfurimonas sp.]